MTKLYELRKGDWFRVIDKEVKLPVGHPDITDEEDDDPWYYFGHLDGMYSYCTDKNGSVVHFAAWTEVEVVNGMEMSSTTSSELE